MTAPLLYSNLWVVTQDGRRNLQKFTNEFVVLS